MNKKTIPGQTVRNLWHIKPTTQIHDHDIRKNNKKQRQIVRKGLKMNPMSIFEINFLK